MIRVALEGLISFLLVAGGAFALVGAIGLAVSDDESLWAGDLPWDLWASGALAMVIGSIMFAIATIRTKALDGRAAKLVAVGAGISLISVFINVVVLLVGLVLFSVGWIWLGIDAIRRDRPVIAAAI